MLQHLVRVDDVPRRVFERQSVNVTGCERDAGMIPFSGRNDVCGRVDAKDPSGSETRCEVRRDRPGSAADVEQPRTWLQMLSQIRSRILYAAPPVGS
jgi:hypothetical protein